MITRSRKRAKLTFEKSFWLDKMPRDVRENIARAVSRAASPWGKRTDAALNLAKTSELQRRAVVASMPKYEYYDLDRLDLSDAWAKLLACHIQRVYVFKLHVDAIKDADCNDSPLITLLSAPQLTSASIPCVIPFLIAIRRSKVLESLVVKMRSCSYRSLVCTLKQVGSSLRKLEVTCNEKDASKCSPPSFDCPMSLCDTNGSGIVTTFCPNLKQLRLSCSHIQPATISFLVKHLPSLETISWTSAYGLFMDISDDDIESLRELSGVSLVNVPGGLQLVSRVSRFIASLFFYVKAADTVPQIVKCPRLSLIDVLKGVEGLRNWIQVLPKLPRLRRLYIEMSPNLPFRDMEDATMTVMKIVGAFKDPDVFVGLLVDVERRQMPAITLNMERISSVVARRTGS